MFQFQGIWLPDGEKHFPEWMARNGEIVHGRGTYQIDKFREAMEWCRSFRTAVDVGAHVGLWSMQIAKRFRAVCAFEPVEKFAECFAKNMIDRNTVLHRVALGNPGLMNGMKNLAAGPRPFAKMTTPRLGDGIDSGGTHVSAEEPDEFDHDAVPIYALDEFELEDVDFLKIDVEGFEHEVLAGARETVRKWLPTIIVEQKPRKLGENYGIAGTPAVDLLASWGYGVRKELGGDYIMTHLG